MTSAAICPFPRVLLALLLIPLVHALEVGTGRRNNNTGLTVGYALASLAAAALVFGTGCYLVKRRMNNTRDMISGNRSHAPRFLGFYNPSDDRNLEAGTGAQRRMGNVRMGRLRGPQEDAPPTYASRVQDEVLDVGIDMRRPEPAATVSSRVEAMDLEPPPAYKEVDDTHVETREVAGRGDRS